MDFKSVKSLKGFSNYEVSKDGQDVRDTRTGTLLDIVEHRGKTGTGVDLVSDDQQVTKRFGLATLYRMSWYAPYPGIIIKARRPKGKVSVFKIENKKLFSEHIRREVVTLCEMHRARNANVYGEFLRDQGNTINLVILNHDTSSVIMHVKSQSWRDGYWIYNYNNQLYEKFSDDIHRKDGLKGDKNLLWPDLI